MATSSFRRGRDIEVSTWVDWPEPLVVMTRRQTPFKRRSLDPKWPLDGETFSSEFCDTTRSHHPILGIVKQRLDAAIDTREESQQLGIIRLTFALDRILNRERDFRFFSGNLTLGHSRIGRWLSSSWPASSQLAELDVSKCWWTSLLDCSVVEMHVKHDEWWHPESSRGRRPPACIFDVAGHAHWLLETLDRELEKKEFGRIVA